MIEEKVLQHSDCRNFCSMDVAKGICRRSQEMVLIDSQSCACFVQLPKCKFCENYAATDESTGVCKAEAGEPWAYPEMIAVTCEMYKPA
jgi:4-hydroxyphenylacetate decarboxylase small subunit